MCGRCATWRTRERWGETGDDGVTLMANNVDLVGAAKVLVQARKVTVLTHGKPDGDAYGSVIAAVAVLRQLGKTARGLVLPPILPGLSDIAGSDMIDVVSSEVPPDHSDVVLIVDTAAWAQLGALASLVRSSLQRTMIVDHHLSGDVPAAWRYIDPRAAACCEVMGGLIEALGDAAGPRARLWTPVVCEALYAGIASDTGWFRFSNTTPQTHEWAARLLQHGVNHAELYRKLEQTERPEKLALLVRALHSLELLGGGQVALMTLWQRDFAETGANDEETERFVDLPQVLADVRVVVLAAEQIVQDGSGTRSRTRLSFRSKPGPSAVNVATVAETFGGGGHARAAGAKVEAPPAEVLPKVRQALVAMVSEAR